MMRAVMSCISVLFVSVEGVGTGWGKDFGVWYIAINQQTHLCSFTWISITGIISYKQLRWPLEQTPSTGTEVFTLDYSSDIIPTHIMTFNYSSEILFGAFLDFTDALRFLHLLAIYHACSRSVSVNNLFTRRTMKPFIRFYLTHSSSEVFINVWSICWKSWTLIKAWDNVRRSLCTPVLQLCTVLNDIIVVSLRRMRMKSALNLLSLVCLCAAQKKWTQDTSEWDGRGKIFNFFVCLFVCIGDVRKNPCWSY